MTTRAGRQSKAHSDIYGPGVGLYPGGWSGTSIATPWVACDLKWLFPEGWSRGQIICAFTRSAKYKDTLGGVRYIDANLARTLLLNGEV